MTPPQVGIRPKLPVPLAVGLCAPAWAIFAFGLIAPLTPSGVDYRRGARAGDGGGDLGRVAGCVGGYRPS
jgi:hypothetical protein